MPTADSVIVFPSTSSGGYQENQKGMGRKGRADVSSTLSWEGSEWIYTRPHPWSQ